MQKEAAVVCYCDHHKPKKNMMGYTKRSIRKASGSSAGHVLLLIQI